MKNDLANYDQRSELYDLEFNDLSDKKLIKSLITKNIHTILEIPCGSGRNIEWLEKIGRKVVFADASKEMIKMVDKKLQCTTAYSNCRAVCADMINYDFRETFDLILVPREGIQLIERSDLLQCLKNLKNNLSKNGMLYIDIAKLDSKINKSSGRPNYISQQSNTYILDIDTVKNDIHFRRWHRSSYANKTLHVKFKYDVLSKAFNSQYNSELDLADYHYGEFLCYANEAGLETVQIYGNYGASSYCSTSCRIIYLFKHKK